MIVAPRLIAPRKHTAVKDMPYESGMDPIHDTRRRFDVRFHLVAIAFLVFDVELLFLYPWAVASAQCRRESMRPVRATQLVASRGLVFGEAMVFIALLVVWASFMPGGKGFSNGGRAARKRGRQQARRAGQLVPQEQSVADAVRHGLLRHRADGHRREQARHRPLRRRSVSLQPAAMRFDDCRRPRGDEDAAGAATHLAADERAEVVHFDGGLRITGGVFDTYCVVQGIDRFIPVDMYVPGCPPRPEQLIQAIIDLQDKIQREGTIGGREFERTARQQPKRALVELTGCHGSTARETPIV